MDFLFVLALVLLYALTHWLTAAIARLGRSE